MSFLIASPILFYYIQVPHAMSYEVRVSYYHLIYRKSSEKIPTKGVETSQKLRIATETENQPAKRLSPTVRWGQIRSMVLLILMHHGEGPYLLWPCSDHPTAYTHEQAGIRTRKHLWRHIRIYLPIRRWGH